MIKSGITKLRKMPCISKKFRKIEVTFFKWLKLGIGHYFSPGISPSVDNDRPHLQLTI